MTQEWLATVNAFVEDTCVIFAVTYLLSRGKTLDSVFSHRPWRSALLVGCGFGLLGASEIVFPGMRAPYLSHTLAVCVAALVGGWIMAASALSVVVVAAIAFGQAGTSPELALELAAVALAAQMLDHLFKHSRQPLVVGALGAGAQSLAVALLDLLGRRPYIGEPLVFSMASIPANGFAMLMIMVVMRDSSARALSEQHRLEAERARALQVSAELVALRARIRPHFLFNTLTALASLCSVDPVQAERNIIKLGRLMRRTLSAEAASLTSVKAEIDYVHAYTDIQSLRFGERIDVRFELDAETMDSGLPSFCLQTLVENAFQHGLRSRSRPGIIRITSRKLNRSTLLTVSDNGEGMDLVSVRRSLESPELPQHGLGIIDRQLRLTFGDACRLRLFSEPGNGTMVAFRVPRGHVKEMRQTA
jgi:signal transduction histidine kinase